MITREDVIYAYRLILGREPENQAVVEAWVGGCPTLEALRQQFLTSEEFVNHRSAAAYPHLGYGPKRVDSQVTDEQLATMVRHVGRTWEQLGRVDPHWSVLTQESFRAASIGENEEIFYASGADSLSRMEAAAARCHVRLADHGRCLELGCGVGRVTHWLAKKFAHVTACDISGPHLAIARQATAERGDTNIDFVKLTTLAEIEALPSFDAFYSLITLQHNPPPVIAYILSAILRRLGPGGVGYFQVLTYAVNYEFIAEDYLANLGEETAMEMHVLPQDALFALIDAAGCRMLEIREDDAAGSALVVSNAVLVTKR